MKRRRRLRPLQGTVLCLLCLLCLCVLILHFLLHLLLGLALVFGCWLRLSFLCLAASHAGRCDCGPLVEPLSHPFGGEEDGVLILRLARLFLLLCLLHLLICVALSSGGGGRS